MKIYVLLWNESRPSEMTVEGVTSQEILAERWTHYAKDCSFEEMELIETVEQYEKWENE